MLPYNSKKIPSIHGNTKLNPGPLKNEPMMTKTAQNIKKIVIMLVMNLRFSGRLDTVLARYGANISAIKPTVGNVTPAIIGWNMVSSSCNPRKYHGAFDGCTGSNLRQVCNRQHLPIHTKLAHGLPHCLRNLPANAGVHLIKNQRGCRPQAAGADRYR